MRTSHLAIALLLGVSTRAAACEKIVVPTYRLAGESVFIGTAQADTVLAGPGTETFGLNQIGAPPGASHDIFGQLVHVDRIGSWPDSQRESLQRSGNLIVLVGWDYGADCGRLIRSGTARWMTPGKSGLFFAGIMRDSAHWVGGKPTFDVDGTDGIPYTGERAPVGMFGGRPAPVDTFLTPEQLLGLHGVLPFYEQRSAASEPYAILAPLQRWIREHPDLAHRPPAVDIIRLQTYNAERLHVEAISTPVAGTYRFTGRFVRTKDGAMTFEETVKRGGVDVMVIHGERLSSTRLKHAP